MMARLGFLLLLALSLQGVAWAGFPDSLITRYPIRDSGFIAEAHAQIYWVSDHEVLFGGYTKEALRAVPDKERPKARLGIWNIETGEVSWYEHMAGPICYRDGYVSYWDLEAPEATWEIKGMLGQTTRVSRMHGANRRDAFSCKFPEELPPLPSWMEGRSIKRLLPEHGFLDLGVLQGQEDEVKYYPLGAGKDEGIVMPFKKMYFHLVTIRFYPFQGAYLIESKDGAVNPWPAHFPAKRLWWLYPDGRVTESSVPHHTSYWYHYATRKGWVYPNYAAKSGLVGDSGIYLVQGERITRLVSAVASNLAVSPDGCRIAYRHDPHDGSTGYDLISRITLRMIDLCKGGN